MNRERTDLTTNAFSLKATLRRYSPLFKSLQTGLLVLTGLAGYMSCRCPLTNATTVLSVAGTLFLAVSGSTILNMWYDRDIDARMKRTAQRPIPSGEVSPAGALRLGLLLSVIGVGWAAAMDPLYGAVVFAGIFFDVAIYTIWLKRRTPWSIVWGGLAGGMPVLAGRALGTGQIEWVGIALALAVLFWIPTHILTFSIRYHEDYQAAAVPTFPAAYGFATTRHIIALSSILAAVMMGVAAYGIGLEIGYLRVMGVLSIGLLALAVRSLQRPSERVNFGLFKYASIYMLGVMLLLMLVQ